jgi:HlyD family secretion protein
VQNVVTYDAVIDVDNHDLRLRPGMTANVTIVYAERRDVLAISNAALRFRPPSSLGGGSGSGARGGGGAGAGSGSGGGRRRGGGGESGSGDAGAPPDPDAPEAKTVWALRSGSAVQVSIHAGLTDGTNTEVVDGLDEGDSVIVDVEGSESSAPAPTSGSGSSRPPGGGGGLRMF